MSRKIAGEATPEELEELEQLTRRHPEERFTMEVMGSLWPAPPRDDADAEAEEAFRHQWGMLDETEAQPARQRKLWPWMTAAATVLLMLGSFSWLHWGKKEEAPLAEREHISEVHARYGARTRITLPDGSVVMLNSGSKLVYDNDMNKRSVREVQVSGEAYFDVAKDAERPFVIETPKLRIHVLGTAFNVRAYPDERFAEATLIRGSIEVLLPGQANRKILLEPKQKLTIFNRPAGNQPQGPEVFSVSALEPLPVEDTAVYVETGWVQNRLTFRDESFEELTKRLQRWYNVKFRFEREELKDFRLTGAFAGESLEEALKAMQLIHPFRYRITREPASGIVTIY